MTGYGALPRKKFRCTIPADASRYGDDIVLCTAAIDELDLRHVVLCAFGKWASEEAQIEEVSPC